MHGKDSKVLKDLRTKGWRAASDVYRSIDGEEAPMTGLAINYAVGGTAALTVVGLFIFGSYSGVGSSL